MCFIFFHTITHLHIYMLLLLLFAEVLKFNEIESYLYKCILRIQRYKYIFSSIYLSLRQWSYII